MTYLLYICKSFCLSLTNFCRRLRKAPAYVTFTLTGSYPDLAQPREGFIRRRLSPPVLSLEELAEQFRTVAGDRRTKGVVLHIRRLQMPFARLQTLRDMIEELRGRGKRVIAWSSSYDISSYYVACAADEILLQQGGRIGELGLSQSQVYMAATLNWIGVQLDAVQISPYKSAADRLTRTSMSQEVRAMNNWLLDANYNELVRAISKGRRLDQKQAESLIDNSPHLDAQAVDKKAIDNVLSEEDLPVYLGSKGIPLSLEPWHRARKKLFRPAAKRPGPYVALIRIEGNIVDGPSARPSFKPPFPIPFLFGPRAGDQTVVSQVRQVTRDKRARAALVYVNSGGGSATASEAMTAALENLAAKKPLVVLMGSVAASGGYYVATPAQWIVAQPGTITGSIGVLVGKLVNADLLSKLLMNRETLTRGENADINEPNRPFSPEQRQRVWEHIKNTYDLFLKRVAQGRRMTVDSVDFIGGGRVWTGRQAYEHGLVDELGGLDTALAKARQLAGKGNLPLRDFSGGSGQPVPPLPNPAALFQYASEGLISLNNGDAQCVCPQFWLDI